MFNRAYQPVIEGGQFTSVQGDAHFHTGDPRASSNRGLDLLQQNVAAGAFYDAAERGDPPRCYPQTRLAILAEIQHWVRNPELRKKLIMWIYGPAGSGKTAIAQTIAEIFAKEGLLVASFFFSRTGIGRNDTSRFIASISYQLSVSIPELRPHIAIAVEQDPLVFSRTLLSQMQALIIKPLNDAAGALTQITVAQPRLVIIDGLDEARGETAQKDLLHVLATSIQQLRIPLIFLIASRPEYTIRQTFNREPLQSLMQGLALDEHYKPDHDIRIFLSAKFSEIRNLHPSRNTLPSPWPSEEDIDYLVRKASGQFIYASTVMKYIDSPRRNPTKQLQIIRGLADPGKDTPFAQLDSLYDLILSSVEDITRVLEILALVFLQTGYSGRLSVDFIETLLGYEPGDIAAALNDMHALVQVPTSDSHTDNKLRLYHASLHDFLMDKSRTERFFLDVRLRHTDLARSLLRYISTASEKEYEDKHRFSAILDEFICHYLEVTHTEELVNDLKNFSLTTVLSNIPIKTFYSTKWDAFFEHLQTECGEANRDLYRRLRDEFDDWIRYRYQQYPEFIQCCISAAFSVLHACPVMYMPDIFNILTHSLPLSDAIHLRTLDRGLFLFQEMSPNTDFPIFNPRSIIENFLTYTSRAGVMFADEAKFGILVEAIVKVLCSSGDDHIPIVVERHSDYFDPEFASDSEWLKIGYAELVYFPLILAAAPEDPKLARLLWELAVQYKDDAYDPISEGREVMADSALEYIRRCGIYVPEHAHQADCSICANYKPTFLTPSPEQKSSKGKAPKKPIWKRLWPSDK
ncbi:hypothetical protein BJ912DRAFT_1146197 [Pholiota molesta]|nr:hypothetical protein BJ912DRAFT_1146197 [Pholiota molesta]